MSCKWDLQNLGEMVLSIGDLNGHVGRLIDGFKGVHGSNRFGTRNGEVRRLSEFCDEKEFCV